MLSGVKFRKDVIETETIVYRSITGTTRRIYRRAPPVR
jgi:fructose-1,6-bisphosphatase II / sedoheptulose-1,7-bisphosphatase